jgi:glycosyltransferase involved in cell wall biosynthesis
VISVVIPARNASRTLGYQLRALARQDYGGEWEVIVADNGSTDDTRSVAQRWAGELPVRVVDAARRSGAAGARNAGAAAAHGEVLAFTDADDAVVRGWLTAVSTIDGPGERFATGPIFRFRDGQDPPAEPRDLPARALPHMGFLDYADGTNFLVTRSLFERVGGFDETIRTGEDVDLSWRLQLADVPIEVLPDAQVAVRERVGARGVLRQYYGYGLGDPRLYRLHRAEGIERPPAKVTLRSYAGLVGRAPRLRSPIERQRWLHQVGRRTGRLVGSARERVFYP